MADRLHIICTTLDGLSKIKEMNDSENDWFRGRNRMRLVFASIAFGYPNALWENPNPHAGL